MQFKKAVRKRAFAKVLLTGPSGSGKTMSALMMAKGMQNETGLKIAAIDTENESMCLYSEPINAGGKLWEPPEFDVLNISPPFAPEKFVDAIKLAESSGYGILLIDSTSHEWQGSGGCLELVDSLAKSKFKGNGWSAFSEVTPRHRAFIDAILHSKMHVIATARSKTETAQEERNGRKSIVKLGMKAEQRDGLEFEFTTVLDISHGSHIAVESKDRTGGLFCEPSIITEESGKKLIQFLEKGVDVEKFAFDLLQGSAMAGSATLKSKFLELQQQYDIRSVWEKWGASLKEAAEMADKENDSKMPK